MATRLPAGRYLAGRSRGLTVRLTGCRTPRRSSISRGFARMDAKKCPINRLLPSLSVRLYQLRPLYPSRSRIPVSSAEIEAFPWRMSRPVWKSPRRVKDGVRGTPA